MGVNGVVKVRGSEPEERVLEFLRLEREEPPKNENNPSWMPLDVPR